MGKGKGMHESDTSARNTTERSHGDGGEVVAVAPAGLDRRRFVGYVLGGATLITAADLTLGRAPARGAVPSLPQIPEIYDLEDLQTDAALPTSQLITVTIRDSPDQLSCSRCSWPANAATTTPTSKVTGIT